MTDAAHIEAEDRRETLWVTDAELIRRMGVPEKIARDALRMLDRDPRKGFPQKQALWGNRRYWPAVRAYLDRTNGIVGRAEKLLDGSDWSAQRSRIQNTARVGK